jgi:hypothetical protein
MLWGNRNEFFYVLDWTRGEFLLGKPFVKQTSLERNFTKDGKPTKVATGCISRRSGG